ncbi:MAG: exonuclease/endonuclease/phosphatase family protein, partial [Planctomycetota bacterium]
QTGILPRSGYASGFHGDLTDCFGCINSGLATMSLQSLVGNEQLFFSDCPGNPCDGIDCMSSKGWIKSVLFKDGFRIVIVNTHTQAGNSSENQTTRQSQLGCLFDWVENYRRQATNTVVFVVGDFNVIGEQAEYSTMTSETLPGAARDGGRNVPQWRGQNGGYTSTPINPLALCFDENTPIARLDYIYFFPSYDGQVTVVPRTTVVYPFRGVARTDSCSEGPSDPLTTTEKSDHYAVKGSFNLYRQ